ncbi:hypothetical protein V7G70_06275 [Acinetobacter pittii]|uniref:hypothetical protein n=1 Tax=Acinetobacter pittii TaxID=48296 RepID=UPI002FF1D081
MSKYFDLNDKENEYFEDLARKRMLGLIEKNPQYKKYNYRISSYKEGFHKYVSIIYGSAVTIEGEHKDLKYPVKDTFIQDRDVKNGFIWRIQFLDGD